MLCVLAQAALRKVDMDFVKSVFFDPLLAYFFGLALCPSATKAALQAQIQALATSPMPFLECPLDSNPSGRQS
jgi:hypothetical protein